MSLSLMVEVFNTNVGDAVSKLILLKLADHARDDGICWPSYQFIAEQCETSRRTVIRKIKQLEEHGFLRLESRVKNNEQQSNIIYLTISKGRVLGGDSLTLGSDTVSLGGDSLTPGGSVTVSPRISNSFEPVKEPIKTYEPSGKKPPADSSDSDKPESGSSSARNLAGYPSDFDELWRQYPRRAGGNPKRSAYKKYQARIRDGTTHAELLSGVMRYANYCQHTNRINTEFVMQAQTFFSNDERFLDPWEVPHASNSASRPTGSFERAEQAQREWLERREAARNGNVVVVEQAHAELRAQMD